MSNAIVTCARCRTRPATIADRLCPTCRQEKDRARSLATAQEPSTVSTSHEEPRTAMLRSGTDRLLPGSPLSRKRGPKPTDSRQARYRRAHPDRTARDLAALRRRPHKRVTPPVTSDAESEK